MRNQAGRGNYFNNQFWNTRNFRPNYYNKNVNWRRWGTSAGVAAWLGWRNAALYYNPYYTDGSYYWDNSEEAAPSEEPVAQQQAVSGEWMPLGVFALSKKNQTSASPNFYLQLALNKQGVISGTLYNSITNQTNEVTGKVDRATQRISLKAISTKNAPTLEMGLYNLTQGEAPALLHFVDGRTEERLLVRMDEDN